nr:tyrosine-type recombinase/integrase [Enterobacter bugandensis]
MFSREIASKLNEKTGLPNDKTIGHSPQTPYQLRHTYACWMLSAGANPAFIANQMGDENAEMVFHVYSAWINVLDSDQVPFLNQRFGGYANAPIVPLKVKTK